MRDLSDLKKRLKTDAKFKELFANKKNIADLIAVAKANGYNVSKEDVEKDETLSDEILASVAGGSKKKDIDVYEHNIYS